jgi:uncharacterized membrane protein YfcA
MTSAGFSSKAALMILQSSPAASSAVTPRESPLSASTLFLAVLAIACMLFGPRHGSPGAVIMAAIFFASLTSSIAGFAFSAICGGLLFHLTGDTLQIVQVMMVCSIANQASMTYAIRRDIDWSRLLVFLAGGILGLPLGVFLLLTADRSVYTHIVGGFLLVYGTFMLFCKPRILPQHAALDVLVGIIGGITGGAIGFPGASVTIWCGCKGWDKAEQRAVFQPFILIMQVIGLTAITMASHSPMRGMNMVLGATLCIPIALLGTSIGMVLYRRLSNRQFAIAVNLLLIVSGASFLL